ncbi:MAG: potassium channel family protein [Alphaproteobacteria bacterium]|nr:potassium channel family protein [Alphaproteobacteria bacterium]
MLRQAYLSFRDLLSVLIASSLLLALVGYATDQAVGLFEISVGSVVVLMLSFYLLFGSGSVFFDIVFANAITIYLCFFTFFIESLFSDVGQIFLSVGFILPLAAFLLGICLRRHKIKEIVTSGQADSDADFARSFLWLLPIAAIGISAFVVHQGTTFEQDQLNYIFLGEMGLIGFVVFLASKDFALLLMDTGIIFSNLFSKNVNLIKPAFAFFTFYSMNIVIFAAIYRIVDHLSATQNFLVQGTARDLSFVESLYFSLVTISTLGYGDILPISNGIRFIVGMQSFLGTMLFFFGVHAILTHKKN